MPIGPEMPTQAKLQAIAERYGLALDATMLAEYGTLIAGTIKACRYVEQFVEQTLPVKYPRTVGQKPTSAENPLNGWSWRCEIKGADSGPLKGYTVGIKDAVCVAGIPMRNGSRILEDPDTCVYRRSCPLPHSP